MYLNYEPYMAPSRRPAVHRETAVVISEPPREAHDITRTFEQVPMKPQATRPQLRMVQNYADVESAPKPRPSAGGLEELIRQLGQDYRQL